MPDSLSGKLYWHTMTIIDGKEYSVIGSGGLGGE